MIASPVPANGRLKVEMVLPALYKAGMEVMAARLGRGLASRGHEIGFTCIEAGDAFADELRDEGFRVTVVPAPGLRSLVRAPLLAQWFRALRPDVVHGHSGAWLKAARAARSATVPRVVHTEHGMLEGESWYTPSLKRCAAHYTDHVVAVAEPIRAYLTGLARVNEDKVSVILNGVDTTQFTPAGAGALRARLALPKGRPLIGNVARLAPIKNHALLIEAFALLSAHLPEAALAIVGDGALRGDLQRRIAARGLDTNAFLLGELRDTAAVYRDFDLFVLTSTIEGTSMSILEAMASGVCVVATAVGGNPDLLGHGRYGVLVPSEDPTALAAAMLDLLRDPGRRQRLAAAARAHVAERYSESAMIGAYEQLYRGRRMNESVKVCAG
jgi:glycosyltransferase involved in cell wall biosynthesis